MEVLTTERLTNYVTAELKCTYMVGGPNKMDKECRYKETYLLKRLFSVWCRCK